MPRTSMSGQMAKRNRVVEEDEPLAASQAKRSYAAAAPPTVEAPQLSQGVPSTQRTMEAAKKAAESLSVNEKKTMVGAIVRYLLFSDKKKIPVKKAQIVEHVPGLKDHGRAFPVLFESAKSELNEVFGFDCVEVSSGTQRHFMLVNLLLSRPEGEQWVETSEQHHLVVLILALVFMKENRLKEEDLMFFLENLGVERERKHPQFGDIDKLLTAFVHQRYLVKEVDTTVQEDNKKKAHIWSWGMRAYVEIDSDQVIATLARLYDQPANDWKDEFKGLIDLHKQQRKTFVK